MKKITTLVICIALANASQAQITFQKTLGGGSGAGFHWPSFSQTNDGGFIVACISSGFDALLIRLNINGDTIWTKTFGGSGFDDFVFVDQTFDGGFIATGYTNSFGQGQNDIYIVKTDSIGNLQWSITYGSVGYETSNVIEQTSDSGYFVSGGAFLFKLDPFGNVLWSKAFNGPQMQNAKGKQTSDGGFIIASSANSSTSGMYSMFLAKLNANGDTSWTKCFGGLDFQGGRTALQTPDGGYILVGQTASFGAGNYDLYLVKTDSIGNLQWSRTFGGTQDDFGMDVLLGNDGGYLMAGSTKSFGAGSDFFLVKTDSSGNLIWSKTYGMANDEAALYINPGNDGGYLLGGFTTDNSTFADSYIIKTDSSGNSGCNQNSPATVVTTPATLVFHMPVTISSFGTSTNPATVTGSGVVVTTLCSNIIPGINDAMERGNVISIFPNPLSRTATISFSLHQSENVSLKIFDVNGRLIKTIASGNFTQGINMIEWNTENIKAGIYFLQMETETITKNQKLIVTKD